MNPRFQKVAHTIAALIAGAMVILPDLLPLLASYPRASRIVGAFLLILTNAQKVPGFAALLAKYAAAGSFAQRDLEKLPKSSPNTPVVCFLAIVLGSLLIAGQARADINLNDIAPKLTTCWGRTCLTGVAAVDAALYDIKAKKFETGTVNLGGGVALLFWADTLFASGPVARVAGLLSQERPSYALVSGGILFCRHIEVAYSRRLAEGPDADYVSLAGVIPFDMLFGDTLPDRARKARMAAEKGGL